MVHAKARDHVNLGRVVAVRLLVEVNGLELILLLLVKVSHLGKNFRISRNFGNQDVVPFESLTTHTNQLINMGDLVNDLV